VVHGATLRRRFGEVLGGRPARVLGHDVHAPASPAAVEIMSA
jgi:hypothetical protein